jgi:Tfp pilus assembly protein PilN
MLFNYNNMLNRENHQLRGQIQEMEELMETEQGRRRDLERTVDRLLSRVTTMESTLNAVVPLVRFYLSRTNLGSCRCWSPFMGVGLLRIQQPWQMMRVGCQQVLRV